MSRQSGARRERRALKAAGVAKLDRVTIEPDALATAVTKGVDLVDLVAFHVAAALERLDESGADVIRGHTVVTIGEHPDHIGAVTIEAKAATMKSGGDDASHV